MKKALFYLSCCCAAHVVGYSGVEDYARDDPSGWYPGVAYPGVGYFDESDSCGEGDFVSESYYLSKNDSFDDPCFDCSPWGGCPLPKAEPNLSELGSELLSKSDNCLRQKEEPGRREREGELFSRDGCRLSQGEPSGLSKIDLWNGIHLATIYNAWVERHIVACNALINTLNPEFWTEADKQDLESRIADANAFATKIYYLFCTPPEERDLEWENFFIQESDKAYAALTGIGTDQSVAGITSSLGALYATYELKAWASHKLNQFSELLAKDVISEIDFCALCLDLYTKTGLEQLIGIAHAHADKLSDDQKEDFEKLKIFIENRATAAGDVGE